MWFNVRGQEFIGKIITSDEGSNFYITDFKNVWHKFLNDNELLSKFKISNPLLEAPVHKIKEVILAVCNENGSIKTEFVEMNNSILLIFESSKMNIKFKFQLTLSKGHESMLWEEFIMPLLYTIQQLGKEKEKLITIIKEKDLEIEEYKRECGFIKNNFAQTKPFCEKEFSNEVVSNLDESYSLDPKILMECMSKKMYVKDKKNLETPYSSEGVFEEKNSIIKDKKHKPNLKRENITQTSQSTDSIKMNHQIVKKRKKLSIRL